MPRQELREEAQKLFVEYTRRRGFARAEEVLVKYLPAQKSYGSVIDISTDEALIAFCAELRNKLV